MSAYDNDPRVERVDEFFLAVNGGEHFVTASSGPDDWWVDPSSSSAPLEQLRTRADANRWASQNARGPFPTADEAIRSLIGDPQP